MAKNGDTKPPKPFYKKWWFWLIVVIAVFGMIGSFGNSSKDSNTNQAESSKTDTVDVQNGAAVKSAEDTKSNETTEPESASKEELKEAIKDKESLVWFGNVRNDVTGNWRLSEYASGDSQEAFAADYYNAFFEDDKEIHAVINMTLKTTGRLSVINSNTIDVTIMEYVKGEEHDAKELFGGKLIKEYWVHLDTGDIEEVQ